MQQSRMFRMQMMRANLIIGSTFLVGTLVLLVLVYSPFGQAQLRRFSLLPEPQRTTAAYFISGQPPPTTYIPNQPLDTPFTIENHEGQATEYRYAVSLDDQQVATGTITIPDGAQQTIAPSVTPAVSIASEQTRLSIIIQYDVPGGSGSTHDKAQRELFTWLSQKEERAP